VARVFGADVVVATVNSIQLAYSRESGDAGAYGRHPQTYLVGGHRVVPMAGVQTFATDAANRSGILCGLCGENCIPDSWRGFAIDAKLSEFELTFPDPMHEFNAGDGDRGAPKALQSKHWIQTKFDRSMVLLYQII